MDRRGFTIDPNREEFDQNYWWDIVGPTDSPSPYATASWVYLQDYIEEGGVIFGTVRVYDSLASYPFEDEDDSNNGIISFPKPSPFTGTIDSGPVDDLESGLLLGHLDYEVNGPLMVLTSWGADNWRDATPVRKAWKALSNTLPDCVSAVAVRDDPNAFWTNLGFNKVSKDPGMLFYQTPDHVAVPY